MAYCASGESCVLWVERYLKDSVSGVRDYTSLAFGWISVISWAVAEIPQIFTNFMSGSTEGISLAFLMTWIVGDLLNLIGCLLEPATLPTQFYTALVYTITTVVLVCQTLYYGHITKWWMATKAMSSPENLTASTSKGRSDCTEPVSIDCSAGLDRKNDADPLKQLSEGIPASSVPIPIFSPARDRSIGMNPYYMSARSLASSDTPTPGSYLATSSHGSGRSGPSYILDQPSVDDELSVANIDSTSLRNSKTMLRSVAATAFFVGWLNYFHLHEASTFHCNKIVSGVPLVLKGRKILLEVSTVTFRDSVISGQSTSLVGTYLGWVMAAIYMGGRLPQILKNVKRGNVEGLNPLMFLFALIGNAAYVGSIMARTLEWKTIKPNMPWLLDAAVCVLLDCFILGQFIYYKMRRPDKHGDNNED